MANDSPLTLPTPVSSMIHNQDGTMDPKESVVAATSPDPDDIPTSEDADKVNNNNNNKIVEVLPNEPKANDLDDDEGSAAVRYHTLGTNQFRRLHDLFHSRVYVHPHPSLAHALPTLSIYLKDIVSRVRDELAAHNISVRDVRINGGAASHVLHCEDESAPPSYNDLDLIYTVRLGSGNDMERIKHIVLETLFLIFLRRFNTPDPTQAPPSPPTLGGEGGGSVESSGKVSDTHASDPDEDEDDHDSIASANDSNPTATRATRSDVVLLTPDPQDTGASSPYPLCSPGLVNQEFLREAYIHKMVKVCSGGDLWSLLALNNNDGRNLELKFVSSMKRQFEFSVDSFQIILDPMLDSLQNNFFGGGGGDQGQGIECDNLSLSPQPTETECYDSSPGTKNKPRPDGDTYKSLKDPPLDIVCESVYGDFPRALKHLKEKLIATVRPEEIRGGGLLKYCNLLIQGYKPADHNSIRSLEKYMCSRFFIDFGDLQKQENKLGSYLKNHFIKDHHTLYNYLLTLYKVVDTSTVCLMGHERREILKLIEDMFFSLCYHPLLYQYYTQHQHPSSHSYGKPGGDYCLGSPSRDSSSASNKIHNSSKSCYVIAHGPPPQPSSTSSSPALNFQSPPPPHPLYVSRQQQQQSGHSHSNHHHHHHQYVRPVYCSYQQVVSPTMSPHYYHCYYIPVYNQHQHNHHQKLISSASKCSCLQCS